MKQKKIISLALGAVLMLSACVIPIPVPGAPVTGVPAETTPRAVQADVERAVRQAAANQLNLNVDAIEIVEMEEVEWPNACLGLPEPDEMCAEVITPGYRVVVQAEGEEYVFRTDLAGAEIRAEMPGDEVATAVRRTLANQLDLEPGDVIIVEVEEMEWPDACLGLPAPDEMCAQMITPGYRVVVEAEGEAYVFRTNLEGTEIRAENSLAMADDEQVAMMVRQMLMQQIQADFDEIEIVEVEEMEWPDGCLGLPATNEMCIQMIIPGYRIVLEVNGDEYIYRSDRQGMNIRLEAAPEAQIGQMVVEWTETDEMAICTTARIGTEGVAFGLCGGPLVGGHFGMLERLEDTKEFRSAYASFEAETPAGRVVFTGEGEEEATEAEQRMIAEWARLVQLEAIAGRSGASWGLAFAWSREGGIAGFNDSLAVYVTGRIFAGNIQNETPVTTGQARLDAEHLAQVYEWIDTLAPFEFEQTDPATADAMTIRIVFSGAGEELTTEAQIQEIQEFASMLHNELSQ
jgi:hypothetical protein